MPLRFLLDEHLRGGGLWQAIQQHNAAGVNTIDAVRVGDPQDLPRGSIDPSILLWAERENRLFVSLDRSTLPGHLTDHLQAGHHSPGILLIRDGSTVPELVAALALTAHAGDPADYRDTINYIP